MENSHVRTSTKLWTVALLVCAAGAPTAQAQRSESEERMREMLRKTTIELRDAQNQNVELRAKVGQLSAQPAPPPPPHADDATLKRIQQQAQRETAALRASLEEAQRALDEKNRALTQWKQAHEQADQLARTRETEVADANLRRMTVGKRFEACEQQNAELVSIATELLDRYRDKSVWDSMRNAEPLTGIHRVKLEALVQQYHAKIIDSTSQPAAE